MVEKLVRYLEMTAPQQLRPARGTPDLTVVRSADPAGADAARIRALHAAIATPHHWSSLRRSSAQWEEALSGPGRSHWLAAVGERDIGWASLCVTDDGHAQIAEFGLRPDVVGSGYGGAFLTAVVRQAWRLLADAHGTDRPARVWLSTTSWDHPHALANYLARGFRVARLELQRLEPGTDRRSTTPVTQPPRFLVRPAVAADAPAVAMLLEDLGYPLPDATVHRRLQRLGSSTDDIVAVVAEQPDDVVGVISAHVVPLFAEADPAFMRITAVSVTPRARGQGVGRRLVEFVEYEAQRHGIALLEVSSGRRPERDAAHRFYAALGFQDSAPTSARYWKHL